MQPYELDLRLLKAYDRADLGLAREALAQGASASVKTDAGVPLICEAIADGRVEFVKELAGAGASLEACGDGAGPSLIEALGRFETDKSERTVETILFLIQAGASPNQRSETRLTPLMLAAFYNCEPALSALLAAGARVDARDAAEVSALGYACLTASLEAMETLIEAGADMGSGSANRAKSSSPMALAKRSGSEAPVALLLAREQKALLERELAKSGAEKTAAPRM